MKIKKIFSFLVVCVLLFGGVGMTESQTKKAYAMPSVLVDSSSTIVWGDDLYKELYLAKTRVDAQRLPYAEHLIKKCIAEGRALVAHWLLGSWHYEIYEQ